MQQVDSLKSLSRQNPKKQTDDVIEELMKFKTFMDCFKNDSFSVINELLDACEKIDTWKAKIFLVGISDSVIMFQDAYQMVKEIENWKPEPNSAIEKFPLNKEDLERISDGIKAKGLALKIANLWRNDWEERDELDFQPIQAAWEKFENVVSKLVEFLLREDTKNIDEKVEAHFTDENIILIDSIKQFVKTDYEGNQWKEILNFFDDLEKLKNEFPDFSSKLEKMNEEISKIKEWEKAKIAEDNDEKKPFVDCSQVYFMFFNLF